MSIGKFLEKNFKNQEVELFVDHDVEWISYAETTKINGMIVHGVFIAFDEETGIITLEAIHDKQTFYISEGFIQMFWKPGFRCTESVKVFWSGQKLNKSGKGRDIF